MSGEDRCRNWVNLISRMVPPRHHTGAALASNGPSKAVLFKNRDGNRCNECIACMITETDTAFVAPSLGTVAGQLFRRA